MKKFFLFFVSPIVFATGCAISNPYGRVTKYATTNEVGTVITQQVGNQPTVVYEQRNYSVTHTSKPVVPPMPNSGINGITATAIGGGQQPPPQQTQPQPAPRQSVAPRTNRGIAPSGARVLRPNRGSYGTPVLLPNRRGNGTLATLGGGLRSFLLPTIPARSRSSGASLTAFAGASGRVNLPVTRFERKALGHAQQVDPYYSRYRNYGVRVHSYNATLAVGGAGQYRSGLRY